MSSWTTKGIIDTLGILLLAVSVCVGVVVVFIDSESRRSQFTFQIVEEYGSKELLEARTYIRSEVLMILEADREIETTLVSELLAARLAHDTDRILEQSILQVVDFYNRLSLCIDSGLCSEKVACELIGSEGRNLYSVLERSLPNLGLSSGDDLWASGYKDLFSRNLKCSNRLD